MVDGKVLVAGWEGMKSAQQWILEGPQLATPGRDRNSWSELPWSTHHRFAVGQLWMADKGWGRSFGSLLNKQSPFKVEFSQLPANKKKFSQMQIEYLYAVIHLL